MRILLLGKNGQIGTALQRVLPPLGHVIALGRQEVDFLNADALRHAVQHHAPDLIINAAAYTAVDAAETNQDLCFQINATSAGILAEEAHKTGIPFLHYSTDYVFDGEKNAPYFEDDATAPLSIYGTSKRAGEELIMARHDQFLILRTSWVYAPHGKNFLNTILNLAQTKDRLTIISDQIGAPNSAAMIADMTARCLPTFQTQGPDVSGIYHLSSSGQTSWFDYACHAIDSARRYGVPVLPAEMITPVLSADYHTVARRPLNSCLATHKIRSTFGLTMLDWKYYVDSTIEESFKL
jgi:dTDP-4-dehydrorhamnose reductase